MLNFLLKNKQMSPINSATKALLDFDSIERKSIELADLIENNRDKLISILVRYESYEVADDEISRTLDLLRHIRENEEYFKLRVGQVTSFLPRNQPLYALSCFVIVPSFMASEVYFRIPHTMKHFFGEVLELIRLSDSFPNIHVVSLERLEFLKDRSALLKDPLTGETQPVTDVVIFTGTLRNAEKLRLVFDKRTLFITNGAGHNPVVVSNDANLHDAVTAVTSLQFYNQGQDCAAPNSVLVHKDVLEEFTRILQDKVKNTVVGEYHDKSSRIGPISEPEDLVRIQKFLVDHIDWIDVSTPGTITTRDSTVAPTIISKPLHEGGNFDEMFAPIIFVQEYSNDDELKDYFEHPNYAPNAMYVTLYGTSEYTKSLVGKKINGQLLHDEATFIHNTHLHAPGVERGTKQYGGYGQGASSLAINGKIIAMPTLPQRDIYEQLVKPVLNKVDEREFDITRFTDITHKNVSKLLQIKPTDSVSEHRITTPSGDIYLDTQLLQKSAARFLKVNKEEIYHLVHEPNTAYISMMDSKDIALVEKLHALIDKKDSLSFEEFESKLYALPRKEDASNSQNRVYQRNFFQITYQLFFARNDGPRLAEFLWSIDKDVVAPLLDAVNIHDQN